MANLARWDWKLMKGLEQWVRLYTALSGIIDPQQASYLKRASDTAKQFKANFEAVSKHLETARPGEKGFPGANVEQWRRYLTVSYTQLLLAAPPAAPAAAAPATATTPPATTAGAPPPPLPPPGPPPLPGAGVPPTFHAAAQTRINTARLQELVGRLQVDSDNLGAQKSGRLFERDALGHALHDGLRGAVDRPAGVGLLRGARGDVHEHALATAPVQVAHEGLAAVEDAEHVHLEVEARGVGLDLAQRRDRLQHARVVHPQVDRAEARLDGGREGGDGGRVPHVEARREQRRAVREDGRAAGAQAQPQAALREGLRQPGAEPAARARDHRRPAREAHASPPVRLGPKR